MLACEFRANRLPSRIPMRSRFRCGALRARGLPLRRVKPAGGEEPRFAFTPLTPKVKSGRNIMSNTLSPQREPEPVRWGEAEATFAVLGLGVSLVSCVWLIRDIILQWI